MYALAFVSTMFVFPEAATAGNNDTLQLAGESEIAVGVIRMAESI